MKPGDMIRVKYPSVSVFRGEEMGVILGVTEYEFTILFTSGIVNHGARAYYCNYYEVVA